MKEKIRKANEEAVKRLKEAEPYLVDTATAIEVIPGMREKMLLHAAPHIDWEHMCGPQKGSAIGAALFEGWAKTLEEAIKLFEDGTVEFEPAHNHQSLAGAGMMISPSMKVFVVENRKHGNKVYTHHQEDQTVALRYGVFTDKVMENLRRARDVIMPALGKGFRQAGGISLKKMAAMSINMGDEGHNRNNAAGCLLEKELMPHLIDADVDRDSLRAIVQLFDYDERWLVYPEMAFCKCMLDAAHGIEFSTLVTAMGRNGTYFGIRVSGLGEEWFTAPAPEVKGFFLPGYTQADANRDMGDSSIMETGGMGAFAMAAAPALAKFGAVVGLGGTFQDAVEVTERMYEITLAENDGLPIPTIDFRGTPTGIDVLKVLEKGIYPLINTSLSHKDWGVGQIGAGWTSAPAECFTKAFERMVGNWGLE
ncbi:MAG: DUF1116 domain-containing protein [Syntrophaceae bacterium]|nr:DUF1116 domain-containing protein [Syntrophaceae bacterium]